MRYADLRVSRPADPDKPRLVGDIQALARLLALAATPAPQFKRKRSTFDPSASFTRVLGRLLHPLTTLRNNEAARGDQARSWKSVKKRYRHHVNEVRAKAVSR